MTSASALLSSFDLLEKEFDRSFVDLDLIISDPDLDEDDMVVTAKEKMSTLSSCFSQICHKSQIAVQENAKLEAERINYRADLLECQAENETLKTETKSLLRQVHSLQLQLHSAVSSDSNDATQIRANMEEELNNHRQDIKKQALLEANIRQLESDNQNLKDRLSLTEKELFGARLAAKYLDKELAGRIQQIQLLGRNVQTTNFQKMWSQLEAEIHLHRHKTVIKACRGNENLPSPPKQKEELTDNHGVGKIRKILIKKDAQEGLGISVTGGRDHGVPILISEIHPGGVVEQTGGLYVGDALLSVNGESLREMKHKEAVDILCREVESLTIEAVYVVPDADCNGELETASSVGEEESENAEGNSQGPS